MTLLVRQHHAKTGCEASEIRHWSDARGGLILRLRFEPTVNELGLQVCAGADCPIRGLCKAQPPTNAPGCSLCDPGTHHQCLVRKVCRYRTIGDDCSFLLPTVRCMQDVQ